MTTITCDLSRESAQNRLRAVDLFCGSGAVTTGLVQAGFRVVAAVDNDPIACRTYKLNHPDLSLLQEDINDIDPEQLVREIPDALDVELLVVCAPCQPFSSQNRKREGDRRASLVLEAIKFASVLNPKCIFFENVAGLASKANSNVLKKLRAGLSALGYVLSNARKIDAADLGVPQRRVRCVMIAARSASAIRKFEEYKFTHERTTVRDAISHLPPLKNGEGAVGDVLHFARYHQDIALMRLAAIPHDGGSRASLPRDLQLACHVDQRGFSDVYGRMRWDDVAPTLTSGCTDVTRGRFAHPEQDRAISLREAALLQTFPPNYCFHGNRRQIATQIGNAVPVSMVRHLLPAIGPALGASTTQVSEQGPEGTT